MLCDEPLVLHLVFPWTDGRVPRHFNARNSLFLKRKNENCALSRNAMQARPRSSKLAHEKDTRHRLMNLVQQSYPNIYMHRSERRLKMKLSCSQLTSTSSLFVHVFYLQSWKKWLSMELDIFACHGRGTLFFRSYGSHLRSFKPHPTTVFRIKQKRYLNTNPVAERINENKMQRNNYFRRI